MTGTGDYEAYPMGSNTSPAVVLRLYVSAVKAGKRAVIGCEHRRIILYRSHVVDALLYLKMAWSGLPAKQTRDPSLPTAPVGRTAWRTSRLTE